MASENGRRRSYPEVLDAAVEVAREVPGVQRVIVRSLPWSLGAAGSSA